MSNIFETATRKKYRFASAKGELSTEQLWDLPLVATGATREVKTDLDTIARSINAELKSIGEGSFVSAKPDPRVGELEAKLEILKHIIGVKQAEIAAAAKRASNAEERRKLLEAYAAKESEEITKLSKDEILKRLDALDG